VKLYSGLITLVFKNWQTLNKKPPRPFLNNITTFC